MSDYEDDVCANCGWPAENCGLAYTDDGLPAHPSEFVRADELHVGPGKYSLPNDSVLYVRPSCRVCYTLQSLGKMHLLERLATRRRQIDAYRSMFINIYKAADEAHRRLLAGEWDVQ